ncbi:MAG TPA: DinB family protein [Thermoanaerobaculia bacterium]|nr:DinB family protein [Thermoanaerobaculia bacterium]
MNRRPEDTEYASFYGGYIARVPETEVLPVLESQIAEVRALAEAAAEKETFRYAPGKWSVREMIGHLTDAERVFGFRAFCFSRGEEAALPGFEENQYVAASGYDAVDLASLVREWTLVREGNIEVLRRLPEEAWSKTGTASGWPISVRALAYAMAGHVRHHRAILRERYGI